MITAARSQIFMIARFSIGLPTIFFAAPPGECRPYQWCSMLLGKKLVIVLPAYNAELTLRKTYAEIPFDIVDEVVLVDDNSRDHTVAVGRELGITHIIKHDKNRGYGGNQKSC